MNNINSKLCLPKFGIFVRSQRALKFINRREMFFDYAEDVKHEKWLSDLQ